MFIAGRLPASAAIGRMLTNEHTNERTNQQTRQQTQYTLSFDVRKNCVNMFGSFYRAMHFSAYARSWDRMSSVRLSVTLVDCDHI